jgi:FkbM family methyltransferase
MRLYRQARPGQDWSGVVDRIVNDLTAMVRTRDLERTEPLEVTQQLARTGATAKMEKPAPYRINNFTAIDSFYGKFVVNRHCSYQAEALIKTGYPHIEHELVKILSIVRALPHDSVVVDAGANIGLVAIPIAREIKPMGGIVHAFEVQRMLFYALCGSAALNDMDNIYIHNKALGRSAGSISAGQPDYAVPQDFGLYSLVDPVVSASHEDVPVSAIDDLRLPRLDFLKIDVEGMELDVLHGARTAIRNFKPWCWVEYWRVDLNEIKASFAEADYRFFPIDQLNLLCAPAGKLRASGITIDGCEI